MEKRSLNFSKVSELKYKCGLCSGKTKTDFNTECPRCKGKGFIVKQVKAGNYHEHTCNICSGTGHNPFNKNECMNCQGTGKIILTVESSQKLFNYS